MLTPFDISPRPRRLRDRGARLRGAAVGVVLVALLCIVMRLAGPLAALVVFYLAGLAVVLKAMLPDSRFSTLSNERDDLIGIRPTISQR